MDEAQAAANSSIGAFMERIAAHIRPSFPMHAVALLGELIGTRLTTERWHRISGVLASLHAVPGFPLLPHEHAVRNVGLAAVAVAQKMAAASFGGKDPIGSREFALWRATEIDAGMSPTINEGKRDV